MSTKDGSASGGKKIILLHKKEGETPLQALERFRRAHKSYTDIKMTYAGRLDPMATGLLLILAGEEVKNKEKYLSLDKEYEFEVLFGFATDTHDILGKIVYSSVLEKTTIEQDIKNNLKYFKGKVIQEYPRYSSKTLKQTRKGEDFEPPKHEVDIKSLKLIKINKISSKLLLNNIEKRIKKVKGPARNAKGIAFAGGDFRQEEILETWRANLSKNPNKFYIAQFVIKCTSGTYVRAIAHELGQRIKVPGLAYSIKRTKIGKYSLRE